MDPLAFLTWQFVLFSLIVAAIMYVFRTILEFCFPQLTTIKVWNSLLLMLLPIFIGAGLGLWWKMYPYATGLTTSAEHIGYGAVAGLLSTVLFKVIKELLVNKITNTVSTIGGVVGGVFSPGVNTNTPNFPPDPNANPMPPSNVMGGVPTEEIDQNK
jgi:hypothetical protein